MNPGGRKSRGDTPNSVNNVVGLKTDELLDLAAKDGFGKRNQGALEALVCFSIVRNVCHAAVKIHGIGAQTRWRILSFYTLPLPCGQ